MPTGLSEPSTGRQRPCPDAIGKHIARGRNSGAGTGARALEGSRSRPHGPARFYNAGSRNREAIFQMAALDDTTSHSLGDEPDPSDPQPEGDEARPVRQRIAESWNRLRPVGKAGVLVMGGVAALVLKSLIASADTRAPAADAAEEDADLITRRWTNHAGGYFACTHQGCAKKVNPTIFGHDCCGRCWLGRDCLSAAQRDYDGPGGFAHNCFEAALYPGVCTVCDEAPEAHLWVFDFLHGDRYPAG